MARALRRPIINALTEVRMLRLIKLAVYALVGYALYEIYRGFFAGAAQGGSRASGSRDLNRALNRSSGRMHALTGEGVGERQQTLDTHGASLPHQVGRGVITR
jgi:hypothetical protein